MHFSESIKQIALLGTSRKMIQITDLPAPLTEHFNQINRQQTDQEDIFLQTVTLYTLYYKSGIQASKLNDSILTPSNTESQSYLTKDAIALLPLVLETENFYFLKIWLTKVQDSNHIVTPEWIHTLFTLTESYPHLKQIVHACCGERGRWVANFNTLWKEEEQSSNEDQWIHGSSLERKIEFRRIRTENPETGIELLKKIWAEENASMRLDFLNVVEQTLTESDEAWLMTLQKDKSQKVKDKAFDLVKRLPNSHIIQVYTNTLKETLQIKKDKSLLGLLNSTKIEIKPLTKTDPLVWESGIEKLSNIKGISDDVFITMQLLENIPPTALETQTSLSAEELIKILMNDPVGINLIDSIRKAANRFMNLHWAEQLILHFPNELEPELISVLPQPLRIDYLIKHIKTSPDSVIQLSLEHVETWSQELARLIFTHTSKNSYSYSKSFYTNCIQHLTIETIAVLPSIQVDENIEHLWANHRSFITNRLQLKKDIQKTTF